MSSNARAPLAGTYVTEEQFMSLPETTARMDLIEGEVFVAPSASFWHQAVVLEVATLLRSWARTHAPARVGIAPLDVRFGPDRILQPDVALFLEPFPDTMPIGVVPALVFEVLSSNRAQDIITKRMIYMQAGVREYWMADRARSCFILSTSLDAPIQELDAFESTVCTGLRFAWADVVPA